MNRGGVKFSLYKSIINIPGKSHNSFKKRVKMGNVLICKTFLKIINNRRKSNHFMIIKSKKVALKSCNITKLSCCIRKIEYYMTIFNILRIN